MKITIPSWIQLNLTLAVGFRNDCARQVCARRFGRTLESPPCPPNSYIMQPRQLEFRSTLTETVTTHRILFSRNRSGESPTWSYAPRIAKITCTLLFKSSPKRGPIRIRLLQAFRNGL